MLCRYKGLGIKIYLPNKSSASFCAYENIIMHYWFMPSFVVFISFSNSIVLGTALFLPFAVYFKVWFPVLFLQYLHLFWFIVFFLLDE